MSASVNKTYQNKLGTHYENRDMAGGPIRTSRKRKYEGLEFPLCPDVTEKYEKVKKIGQGTFGEVFKARCKKMMTYVALKKVLMQNKEDGFPITALKEIRILKFLKHENIVNLIEVCQTRATEANNFKSQFYLVFEFCEHDLAGLLANQKVIFSLGDIKSVMQQLLDGLFFIHFNNILHRDMKPANILVTKNGILKLADFGLSRAYNISKGAPNTYTNKVVTLWYRPPELLLGERDYSPAIDMWGTGCIMAEMWTRRPILQGTSEQHQLGLITQLCGSITPEVWPGVEKYELFNNMVLPKGLKRTVRKRLELYVKDRHAIDLLDKLLIMDHKQRINADATLNHEFFWQQPLPSDLGKMISQHTSSMFYLLAPPLDGKSIQNVPVQQPVSHALHRPNGYSDQNYERIF